jgi:hypothetical protein
VLRPNPLRGAAEPSGNPIRRPFAPVDYRSIGKPPDPIDDGPDRRGDGSFDPIKDNGPIFVGWSKPRLALVITGREDGYLEPCGCAGLDRMKGGFSRRYTMIETLRKKKGWPVVTLDVGGLAKGFGPQTELKFQITVDAMSKMGYDAIGFGPNDLRLPAAELVSVAASTDGRPSPFVSANVGLLGFAAKLTAQTRVVEAAGMKIGITAVLGKEYQREIHNEEIELADPETALAQIVPVLRGKCDLMILLAHATKEESIALARRFPEFALVVTAGGPPEPPAEPMPIEGTQAKLIEVGEKGMDAIVLGLYDNARQPMRYQRVPLDSRFASSDEMRRLMKAYQDQLRRLGLEGLHIHPVSHPQTATCGSFVGSRSCESCHEEAYRVWKKSGHAKAWRTLVESDPARNFDPECISCHVVGWHPTKHYPYKTGFLDEQKTPKLVNVGCEACHGPCGAHAAAEQGSDLALQETLREAIALTEDEVRGHKQKSCRDCHDLDNSPDFDFETYWPKVKHVEEE